MRRDPVSLSQHEYDVAVIGGGIYGACVAWEAASRGLSVALLEMGDFASATSANSLKTIHGGFRYLQHADIARMRESLAERRILMRIAPHLVHPLPVLVPAYGHGMKGREALTLALLANEVVSFDRNRLDDPQKFIPAGSAISRQECLRRLPGIDPHGLTGGAIFYDAQVYNSERLVLAYLRSAAEAGAQLANYVRVTGLLRSDGRIFGVQAVDILSGDVFDVRARVTVNTSGPWIDQVLGGEAERGLSAGIPLAKAVNLVTRPLFQTCAVGLVGENGYLDTGSLVKRSAGLLFVTPWRDVSIVGTTYQAYTGSPDDLKLSGADIQAMLSAINQAYPPGRLRREDVAFAHVGLLPASSPAAANGAVDVARHYRILDHHRQGVKGLLSVVGVKYTTARHVAARTIDRVFQLWGQRPVKSVSKETRLHGGRIGRFDAFLQTETGRRPCGLGPDAVRSLVFNYGSAYPEVLGHMNGDAAMGMQPEMALIRAQALHAVREEMACKLADVIFRRTDLGTAGHPGQEKLRIAASAMEEACGWSKTRLEQELDQVERYYQWDE